MELYLLQHGEATPEEVDAQRPLSARGREDVTGVARAAHKMAVLPQQILHSGKLRAQQSAEILARELGVERAVVKSDGLAPNDDPAIAARLVGGFGAPVILVGHLPHLSRLTGLLVAGDPARELVAFRMGALICLVRAENGAWRIRWILPPELGG
jgi:phosphohistidine phosphatase